MVELNTKPGGDVMVFIESLKDETRRSECITLLNMMKQITKEEPVLWGGRIVGFGTYTYTGKNGKSGNWFMTGFSAGKQNITVYIIAGLANYAAILNKLGKYKTGVSCLYLNSLRDVDIKVVKELVTLAYKEMKEKENNKN